MSDIEKLANVLTAIVSLERGGREASYQNIAIRSEMSKNQVKRLVGIAQKLGYVTVSKKHYRMGVKRHVVTITRDGHYYRELILYRAEETNG